MFTTEEEARAHVRAQVAQAEERQDKAQQMVAEMAALAVTATSREREVTVTLGQGGFVTDVLFDRIDGLDAHQLGAAFMEANHHAQLLLTQRVEALSQTYYGKDSATTEVMREQYRAMFPHAAEPSEEHRPRSEFGGRS